MTDTITVDRDAMAHALAVVGKVTPWAPPPKSITTMALGLIRLDVANGVARLSSANADRSITATFPARGGDIGASFAAILVDRWIQKARSGQQVELSAGEETMTLLSGRSRATVPTDIPAMPARPVSTGPSVTVTAAQMHAGLTAVIAVPKEDVTQPILGTVLMHGDSSSLGFIATDSNRVHEMTCAPSAAVKAVLPNDTARLLLAVLPNDTTPVDIIVGERSISFASATTTITSALMNHGFPSVAEKFAQAGASVLSGAADDILADLNLVATVSDMKERDFALSLGSKCVASAISQSGGARGEVQLVARWHGAPLDISFALRAVRDALQLFGDAQVEWHMDGQLDATVITSPAHPELRALVAPFLPRFQPERMAA